MFKKIREEAKSEADRIQHDARQVSHFAQGGVIEHYKPGTATVTHVQTKTEFTSRLGKLISGQKKK
ncbi:hypothetical protein KCMC57_up31810 [Kitasatospora sp. CMC57]|uniref:Uncharacterized protein n=1 Tax=Kitasatospora sp. CMC57 TaxID=3231513 RepID=A0AB33JUB6_9ACTN